MNGAFSWSFQSYQPGGLAAVEGAVIEEAPVRIHVNGLELARIMATPDALDLLALGFLRSEGIIAGLADVRLLHVCPSKTCVEVWLHDGQVELPGRPILTSGCGGGITFDDLSQRVAPVRSDRRISPEQIDLGMRQLLAAAELYRVTRGVHTSGLSDGDKLLAVAEDVGRHNTVDKLWGACMRRSIETAGQILLSTGRISSEMLNKAAKMRIPVVASRTSPTSLSVRLAQEWDITLIGYARGTRFNVYAAAWRLGSG